MKKARFHILTLFPDSIRNYLETSLFKKAQEKEIFEYTFWNPRDFSLEKRKQVDSPPYGGGGGMLLQVAPIERILRKIRQKEYTYSILLSPRGYIYHQKKAFFLKDLLWDKNSPYESISLICGHYEGIDERIGFLVEDRISIGEYVLSGGELPALVLVDSILRLYPGFMGNPRGPYEESFSSLYPVEYPQYTRPRDFQGLRVPEVLLSGNHKRIQEWRKKKAKEAYLIFKENPLKNEGKNPDIPREAK